VQQLEVLSAPPHQYLLAVHEGSGAAVWDLRAQALAAVLPSGTAAATAAAWLPGSSDGDFVTGHADGAVCVWAMPPAADGSSGSSNSSSNTAANGSAAPPEQQALQASLVHELRVCGSSSAAGAGRRSPGRRPPHKAASAPRCHPVRRVEFVAGAVECVAVLGGGELDAPEALALLLLPESAAAAPDDPQQQVLQQPPAAAGAVRLPWLGPILDTALVPMQVCEHTDVRLRAARLAVCAAARRPAATMLSS
jgi:hypothetical protein